MGKKPSEKRYGNMKETDLIDRQQAIGGMRKLQRWNVIRGYNKNKGFLYDDVMYLLEKLPSVQLESHWTPCNEKPPEKNGYYLVTGRQGAVNKRKYEDGRWYGNWAVVAWMPLPEPYKEDGEAE